MGALICFNNQRRHGRHAGLSDVASEEKRPLRDRSGFPNDFSALIYIKAKSQKTAYLHCTERAEPALKLPCALLTKKR